MMAQAVQLGISLAAIGAIFWLARRMGLGGDVRIRDRDHACQIASDAFVSFKCSDAAVDLGGYSALVRDDDGRHVLIWILGNRFVTRMLSRDVEARLDQKQLTINPHEPGAEKIILTLGEAAQFWAAGLRHIPQ